MIRLVIVVLAGFLILDVAVEVYGSADAVRRRRDRERDRWEMRRALARTRGIDTGPRRRGER